MDIDTRSIIEILKIINDEDKRVASAVESEINFIAKATELVVDSFREGWEINLCWRRDEWQVGSS